MLELQQHGQELTGSVGPEDGERFTIRKGRLDANKIHLEVEPAAGDPSQQAMVFELTVDGDRISGNVNGEADGSKIEAKLDVKRQKAD